jgi:hypothetical protein
LSATALAISIRYFLCVHTRIIPRVLHGRDLLKAIGS